MSSANSTPRSFQPRSSPLPIVEADYDQDSVRSFDQSAINKHILSSTNYQILNVIPSPPQQEAVRVLQHLDNHLVTQSLAIIRSFQPAQFQPGSLAEKEFRAYLQLSDCADDLVTKWLNSYRSSGRSIGSRYILRLIKSYRHFQRPSMF
jgi:succinate dehydrogenase flavin-adding protein (antitoxin of CptAB toxin-antitoxin module)